MNANKARVLVLDDEERILRALVLTLKRYYDVRATTDPYEALDILRNENIDVVVSDQKMPVMLGAEFLRQAKEISPQTMRLLLTGYSEIDAIMSSVNEGEIFRFIHKPWNAENLKDTVAKAAAIAASSAGVSFSSNDANATDEKLQILVVDSDDSTRQRVQNIFAHEHTVFEATSVEQAIDILDSQKIAIIISEVQLDDQDVTTTIKLLKQNDPGMVMVVVTSFEDTDTMIGLINEGQVYRFVPKPLGAGGMLGIQLKSAVRHYRNLSHTPQLVKRHVTEKTPETETLQVSDRILDYLNKMRKRNQVVQEL